MRGTVPKVRERGQARYEPVRPRASKTDARNGRNHEIEDGSSVSLELLLARTSGSSCAVNLHFRQVLRWLHCIGDPKKRLSGVIRIRGNCKSRGQYCVCCQGSCYINSTTFRATRSYIRWWQMLSHHFRKILLFGAISNRIFHKLSRSWHICDICITFLNKTSLNIIHTVTSGIIFSE